MNCKQDINKPVQPSCDKVTEGNLLVAYHLAKSKSDNQKEARDTSYQALTGEIEVYNKVEQDLFVTSKDLNSSQSDYREAAEALNSSIGELQGAVEQLVQSYGDYVNGSDLLNKSRQDYVTNLEKSLNSIDKLKSSLIELKQNGISAREYLLVFEQCRSDLLDWLDHPANSDKEPAFGEVNLLVNAQDPFSIETYLEAAGQQIRAVWEETDTETNLSASISSLQELESARTAKLEEPVSFDTNEDLDLFNRRLLWTIEEAIVRLGGTSAQGLIDLATTTEGTVDQDLTAEVDLVPDEDRLEDELIALTEAESDQVQAPEEARLDDQPIDLSLGVLVDQDLTAEVDLVPDEDRLEDELIALTEAESDQVQAPEEARLDDQPIDLSLGALVDQDLTAEVDLVPDEDRLEDELIALTEAESDQVQAPEEARLDDQPIDLSLGALVDQDLTVEVDDSPEEVGSEGLLSLLGDDIFKNEEDQMSDRFNISYLDVWSQQGEQDQDYYQKIRNTTWKILPNEVEADNKSQSADWPQGLASINQEVGEDQKGDDTQTMDDLGRDQTKNEKADHRFMNFANDNEQEDKGSGDIQMNIDPASHPEDGGQLKPDLGNNRSQAGRNRLSTGGNFFSEGSISQALIEARRDMPFINISTSGEKQSELDAWRKYIEEERPKTVKRRIIDSIIRAINRMFKQDTVF